MDEAGRVFSPGGKPSLKPVLVYVCKKRRRDQAWLQMTPSADVPEWSKGGDLRSPVLSTRGFEPHHLQCCQILPVIKGRLYGCENVHDRVA